VTFPVTKTEKREKMLVKSVTKKIRCRNTTQNTAFGHSEENYKVKPCVTTMGLIQFERRLGGKRSGQKK